MDDPRIRIKDKGQLVKLYLEDKMTMDQLGEIFKVNSKTIRKWLVRFGVDLRSKSEAIKIAYKRGTQKRRFGSQNSRWVGEKTIDSKGYVLLYTPGHPRANKKNRVMEHIVVWEKTNGRSLPLGWIIHHLNGVRNDNRPENLIGLPSRQHNHLIPIYRKRIKQLETQVKELQSANYIHRLI